MTITLALIIVVGALAVGAGLGAYRAFQSPAFYSAIILLIWDRLRPAILEMVAKDFSPEHVKKVREAARRAEEIENSRIGPRHPNEK